MVTGGFKDGTETVFGRRCGGIRKKRGTLISRHIIQRMLQRNPAKRSAQRGMVAHLKTSSGRNQCLAQATQPDQTPSRIGHDTTRPRNHIRENKIEWANIAGWTK